MANIVNIDNVKEVIFNAVDYDIRKPIYHPYIPASGWQGIFGTAAIAARAVRGDEILITDLTEDFSNFLTLKEAIRKVVRSQM